MRKRIALAIGVASLIVVGTAMAHFQVNVYTHDQCPPAPPGSRIDPVNFVFYEYGTTAGAVNHTAYHAGWNDTSGGVQRFEDHTGCYNQDQQRASGWGDRTHIRFHQIDHLTVYNWATVGDAHKEDFFETCPGHAVEALNGFNDGRRELRLSMEAGGHQWWTDNWGNTYNMYQSCSGNYAASDGIVVWVEIWSDWH